MSREVEAHAAAPNSTDVVVRFEHVTKTYKLYKSDRARIKSFFSRKYRKRVKKINANDDLSFEIRRGEAVAFMGLNGAGKSTALKMITGVTYPTSGRIEVNGRISALLELSAGFDRRLTGRENIRLRAQIMGIDKEELKRIEPEIIEFANLGDYIDQPMKTYSSGMRSRVGFAFAVAIQPEILIVDEVLAVGDRSFKRKCLKRMREIMDNDNVTILFVTHTSSTAQRLCTRGIVLDHGKLAFDGDIEQATEYYEAHS